jgi:hypothetical protein
VNDVIPGDGLRTSEILFVAGVFAVGGLCFDNQGGSGADRALLGVEGPGGSSFAISEERPLRTDPRGAEYAVPIRVPYLGRTAHAQNLAVRKSGGR